MNNNAAPDMEPEHNTMNSKAGAASDLNSMVDAAPAVTACAPDGDLSADDAQLFRLTYEEDGVYLETSEHANEKQADIISHLKRKNLQQMSTVEVDRALKSAPCRVCIAPAQGEHIYDEEALITISSDQMEAFICLLPPDKGGNRLSYQQVVVAVASKGVSYGIDEAILKGVLDKKLYGEEVCFAKGTYPVDGENGLLTFHFNRELAGKPAVDEMTGKVDYMNLNLFVQVKEGQKLVSRTPATAGTPGCSVTSRVLNPISGKEAKLPSGKNVTYDEDRSTMFAGTAGKVDYKNNTVSVSSCYTVSGDADLETGSIIFDGDVVVKGNVISTISIEATKNIEVYGVVEGAKLKAGGSILLRSGMLGNDKGTIEADGNITAKYIERTRVKAGGDIIVDSMIHCVAESGGSIVVKGKHGSLLGGSIKAQNSITAQSIGSVVNVRTNIEVGIAPAKIERMRHLTHEMSRIEAEIDKFEKIISYLSRMEKMPPEKEQMKRTATVEKIRDVKLLNDYTNEIKTLEEDVKKAELGKVHVTDTIYPGVKLKISLDELVITTPIKFATFYCKNREISYTSCQI